MLLSFNLRFFSIYQNSINKTDENRVLRIFENLLLMYRKADSTIGRKPGNHNVGTWS